MCIFKLRNSSSCFQILSFSSTIWRKSSQVRPPPLHFPRNNADDLARLTNWHISIAFSQETHSLKYKSKSQISFNSLPRDSSFSFNASTWYPFKNVSPNCPLELTIVLYPSELPWQPSDYLLQNSNKSFILFPSLCYTAPSCPLGPIGQKISANSCTSICFFEEMILEKKATLIVVKKPCLNSGVRFCFGE